MIKKVKRKGKIAVAMSGGVDSSVTAFLLKKKGFDVVGIFMRLGDSQKQAENAARRVCQKIGIKFYSVNLSSVFQKEVIEYFLDSYQKGLTPNPCIKCNRVIKFGELFKKAKVLDVDMLATGHYVKKFKVKNSKLKVKDGIIYKLYKAEDSNKDQSYFLYGLNQELLAQVLFPLGEYKKEEVRKIADKAGLPYIKKESQDICFLNEDGKIIEHNEFLKNNLKLKPGLIKNYKGKILGEHKGLPLYTIGQRKGIEIGGTGPYYALKMDYKTNTLFVVNDFNDTKLFSKFLFVKTINWISGRAPKMPQRCQAVIRYRHAPIEAVIKKEKNNFRVVFKDPQRAITPGQSVVFYQSKEVLGGGIIIK